MVCERSVVMNVSMKLFSAIAMTTLAACDQRHEERNKPVPQSHTATFETETLAREIDAYKTNPTAQQKAKVDRAFAELDGEIHELEARLQSTTGAERAETDRKLAGLKSYRNAQRARYAGDRAETLGEKASEGIKDAVRETREAIKETGDAVKDAVH